MILCIADVVPADLLAELRRLLPDERFADGAATAGWHARLVKRNRQVLRPSPALERARERLIEALAGHEVFRGAALPSRFGPLLFSRADAGMGYGSHVDDALMGSAPKLRSDVSFTVFLSPPESYEGGELVIETPGAEQPYKLAAGAAIVYPSTTLHRVETVRHGTRYAAVGWLQSLVREAARRELLFDLERARRGVFARDGKSHEFDLLSKATANLLRMWAET